MVRQPRRLPLTGLLDRLRKTGSPKPPEFLILSWRHAVPFVLFG
jgi:hypothetical protein